MAIVETAGGRDRLSPAAASVLLQGFNGAAAAGAEPHEEAGEPTFGTEVVRQHPLSRREVDICRLLVAGSANRDIARRLHIEEKTVKNHLNRIFAKLGAANRAEAIAICLGTRRVG